MCRFMAVTGVLNMYRRSNHQLYIPYITPGGLGLFFLLRTPASVSGVFSVPVLPSSELPAQLSTNPGFHSG